MSNSSYENGVEASRAATHKGHGGTGREEEKAQSQFYCICCGKPWRLGKDMVRRKGPKEQLICVKCREEGLGLRDATHCRKCGSLRGKHECNRVVVAARKRAYRGWADPELRAKASEAKVRNKRNERRRLQYRLKLLASRA